MSEQSKPFRGRRWQVDLGVSLTVILLITVFMVQAPAWLYEPLAAIPFEIRLLAILVLMVYMFARDFVLNRMQLDHSEQERCEQVDRQFEENRRHYDQKTDRIIEELAEIGRKVNSGERRLPE